MSNSRVTDVIGEFGPYLGTTTDHLFTDVGGIKHYERLDLTLVEANKWKDNRIAWDALHPKYVSKATHTSVVTEDLGKLMRQSTRFMNPLIDRIAVHPACTNEDRLIFNIAIPDHTHSERPKIDDIPMFSMKPISNGDFKATARVSTDASRASIHPDADGLEIIYVVSATVPTSLKDLVSKDFSKKAIFTFSVGSENTGKNMYYAVRWVNLSDKSKSSSYTTIQKMPVP